MQQRQANGGQLYRQRDTIQPPTDLGHWRAILVSETAVGVGGHGPLLEESDRVGMPEFFERTQRSLGY